MTIENPYTGPSMPLRFAFDPAAPFPEHVVHPPQRPTDFSAEAEVMRTLAQRYLEALDAGEDPLAPYYADEEGQRLTQAILDRKAQEPA